MGRNVSADNYASVTISNVDWCIFAVSEHYIVCRAKFLPGRFDGYVKLYATDI